ncbi:MAG: amidohydrolase [Bacteroidetes bacterium HGW-Bacteroidetes-9]|nr:MAG: amidohydrolase [Bacteroidetes bacterium HGW-Bacteroidetes-9]
MVESLIELRHDLHRCPELSGMEKQTARRIIRFLKPLKPDLLFEKIGGYGIMAVFDSGQSGPEVLFRADMDALPIAETNRFDHRSQFPGIAHKCGHDGHSAILAGLAAFIASNPPQKGKFLLLFQPAEESGKGAVSVLSDQAFRQFHPEYCFALHNLPGYDQHTVIIRNGTFAAASRGMIIRLKSRPAQSGVHYKNSSPATAMAQLMANLPKLSGSGPFSGYNDFVLLSLVYGSLGTPAFGTTPGEAVIMVSLRAYLDADMEKLIAKATAMVKEHAGISQIDYEISYSDEFPAVINHPDAVNLITDVAFALRLRVIEAGLPFRWSEDFAHFALQSKAALFGIGAGTSVLPLHDPDYDFPDGIIPTGISIWNQLYLKLAFNK